MTDYENVNELMDLIDGSPPGKTTTMGHLVLADGSILCLPETIDTEPPRQFTLLQQCVQIICGRSSFDGFIFGTQVKRLPALPEGTTSGEGVVLIWPRQDRTKYLLQTVPTRGITHIDNLVGPAWSHSSCLLIFQSSWPTEERLEKPMDVDPSAISPVDASGMDFEDLFPELAGLSPSPPPPQPPPLPPAPATAPAPHPPGPPPGPASQVFQSPPYPPGLPPSAPAVVMEPVETPMSPDVSIVGPEVSVEDPDESDFDRSRTRDYPKPERTGDKRDEDDEFDRSRTRDYGKLPDKPSGDSKRDRSADNISPSHKAVRFKIKPSPEKDSPQPAPRTHGPLLPLLDPTETTPLPPSSSGLPLPEIVHLPDQDPPEESPDLAIATPVPDPDETLEYPEDGNDATSQNFLYYGDTETTRQLGETKGLHEDLHVDLADTWLEMSKGYEKEVFHAAAPYMRAPTLYWTRAESHIVMQGIDPLPSCFWVDLRTQEILKVDFETDILTDAEIMNNWPLVEEADLKEVQQFVDANAFRVKPMSQATAPPIDGVWVRKWKKLPDETLCVKSRLCARGFLDAQKKLLPTRSTTATRLSQRLVISLCVIFDLEYELGYLRGLLQRSHI